MTVTRKTELLGETPEPVPLFPPQIPRGLTWNWTGIFAVRGRWLTDWALSRPILGHVMLAQWMSYPIKQVILSYYFVSLRCNCLLPTGVIFVGFIWSLLLSSRNTCESIGYVLYLHYKESTPWGVFGTRCWGERGKYELSPAVKKLYQLRPKVYASRVPVASRVVNPKHDEWRPAVSKELYQLHRKIWVYKKSKNWKVFTQLHNYKCTDVTQYISYFYPSQQDTQCQC